MLVLENTEWLPIHIAVQSLGSWWIVFSVFKKPDDSIQELTQHCILHDDNDVEQIVNEINQSLKPFTAAYKNINLCCLTTARTVLEGVKLDLLRFVDIGKK